jgi:EAL domain-containing protein (putative c-di-GMP-specific phosphodiesterase class I)/GGDEF domain-containing protein
MHPERAGHGRSLATDEDLQREWLAYGSKYDIQTGLLNPHWFQQGVEALLRETAPVESVAMLWIDVLNLQREFALWGWSGADALVGHVAGTLRTTLQEDALIGRFGRCFVACQRVKRNDPAARRRLQAVVDSIIGHGAGLGRNPDVAAGVAFYPDDADCAEDLARYASLAAELAAVRGRGAVLAFQPNMNSRMIRDHQMEREIEKALDSDQMRMHYQPNVNLATGEALGAEALLRWTHPQWGQVPPSEFIPIAERSNLIHRIFEFTLRAALRDTQRWIKQGIAPASVAVNVSPANLRLDDVARRIRTIMAEFPIHPVELELEVTESLLMDDEKLFTTRIRQLKTIGVRVAIDDFGTRYTGFDLLKRLPIDTMKIDRCFIRGIHRSPDLCTLCKTIVAMGRHMKMRTVAEGIEEGQELGVLRDIGCDAGQGFLLQRPVSSEEFTGFLQRWPQRRVELGFAVQGDTAEAEALCGHS